MVLSVVNKGEARKECPLIPGTSRYHPLNVKEAGNPRSEFVCSSVLSNFEHMRDKHVGMLKGEKRFIRFRAPVSRPGELGRLSDVGVGGGKVPLHALLPSQL